MPNTEQTAADMYNTFVDLYAAMYSTTNVIKQPTIAISSADALAEEQAVPPNETARSFVRSMGGARPSGY